MKEEKVGHLDASIWRGEVGSELQPTPAVVKIYVLSTKTDFIWERRRLWEETLPELQLTFLSQGIDIHMVDCQQGLSEDIAYDTHTMAALIKDLETSRRNNVRVYVIILLGDKLGHYLLPEFIEAGEFLTIKSEAYESGKDVKLLEAWYKQDELHLPPGFSLQPVNTILRNNTHRISDNSADDGQEPWVSVHDKLLDILQTSVQTCYQEGRIRDKDKYFVYGIDRMTEEVMGLCPDSCLLIQRDFSSDSKAKKASRRNILKRTKTKSEEQLIQEKVAELSEALSAKIANDRVLRYSLKINDTNNLDPFNNTEYSEYLDRVHEDVTRTLSENLRQRALPEGDAHLLDHLTSHLYHCQRCVGLDPAFDDGIVQKIQENATQRRRKSHKMLLVYGAEGSGKTVVLSRACHRIKDELGDDCVLVVRYVGLTHDSVTSDGVLASVCSQIDGVLGRRFVSPADHMDLIIYYRDLMKKVESDPRLWIVAIDDLDLLLSWSELATQSDDLSWIAMDLPANVLCIGTLTAGTKKERHSALGKLIPSENVYQIPALDDKQLERFVDPEHERTNKIKPSLRKTNLVNVMKTSPSPLFCVLLLENVNQRSPDATLCTDVLGADPESAVVSRLEMLEERYGIPTVAGVLRYLCASPTGITELELIDVLSCDNDVISRLIDVTSADQIRFPYVVWLRMKSELGGLLEEHYLDQKLVLCFSHRLVQKVIQDKYQLGVPDMMKVHCELADLYMETWISGRPLIVSDSNLQIMDNLGRFINQQPLVYGDTKYNVRKIKQLWRHLLYSGKTNILKEECFCRFEYLLAYLHSTSLASLLYALDIANSLVLDNDIQIVRSVLTQSIQTLNQDPLQLANELIGQLQQIKDQYKTHLDSLVQQAMEWCDSFHKPILVPLSSWLPDPRVPLITKATFTKKIAKLCVSPTGQHVFCAAGSDIYMCHVASNKQTRVFGHTADVTCLECAQDGGYLFSGSVDGSVNVWQINTGRIRRTIREHTDAVLSLSVSSPADILITGSKDRLIKVIQVHTGEVQQTVAKHSGPVTCVKLNATSTLLATGSSDKTINMWEFEDMVLLYSIDCRSPVTQLLTTTDNTFLLYACQDNSVHVASQVTGTVLHELMDNKILVGSLTVSKDSVHCAVGGLDGHLYIYNLRSRELLDTFTGGGSLCDVTATADDHFIFTACKDRVMVWTFYKRTTNSVADTDNSHTKPITCYCMSVEGKMAITGSDDCLVKLWNLDISDFIGNLEGHSGSVTSVAVAAQEAFAVSGAEDKTVKVWSIMMSCVITDYKEHNSPVVSISVLSDNRRVLTADRGQVFNLWQAENGVTYLTLHGPTHLVTLAPNKEIALSVDKDESSARLWHVDNGTVIQVVSHTDHVTCATYSADSQLLATGSADTSLKVWEASSGKLTQVLVEHEALVSCAAITTDNCHVVSGSHDKCLLVWNLSTGEVQHRLIGHRNHVTCVKITEDNSITVSGSSDGTILVWDIRKGVEITMFDTHAPVISFDMNHNADKMVVLLENSNNLPLLCLHNSPASLKGSTAQLNEDSNLLPIRPRLPTFHRQITTYSYPVKKCYFDKLQSETSDSRTSPQKAPLQAAQKAKAKQRREKVQQKSQREERKTEEGERKSSICAVI